MFKKRNKKSLSGLRYHFKIKATELWDVSCLITKNVHQIAELKSDIKLSMLKARYSYIRFPRNELSVFIFLQMINGNSSIRSDSSYDPLHVGFHVIKALHIKTTSKCKIRRSLLSFGFLCTKNILFHTYSSLCSHAFAKYWVFRKKNKKKHGLKYSL